MLHGYGPQILHGAWETIELAFFSLVVAFVFGLIGAAFKLSGSVILRGIGAVYTTLVRSIPDLVLMFLLFYSLQLGVNAVTDLLGMPVLLINPFWTGVITIGLIYGAYFTETFRGALLSVPTGQIEAARAYGMTPWQRGRRIVFPQMMRIALPSIGNNWLVILKATALVSIIGLSDLVKVSQEAGNATGDMFVFIFAAAVIYLLMTSVTSFFLWMLQRKYSMGIKVKELF